MAMILDNVNYCNHINADDDDDDDADDFKVSVSTSLQYD